jgi:hypothetical protein
MARIRSIKPEFFDDEELCALSPWHRLCFAGLWTQADRDGRLEDRPKRLKTKIFPYDDLDMEGLLVGLASAGFILRYEAGGRAYVQVLNFLRHQLPSRDEPPSELPMPTGELGDQARMPNATVRARIYARDHFRCVYCQRDMNQEPRLRTVDHVIPFALGGSHHESNLATCCKPCNLKKHNRNPAEAGMSWPHGLGMRSDSQTHVNPQLTTVQHPPDTNRDRGMGNGIRDVGGVEVAADAAAPVGNRAGDLADLWNTRTQLPIPRCRELTDRRKRHCASRLKERPFEQWAEVVDRIQASAFCHGNNDRGWKATFDWMIESSETAVKVLEGKYDGKRPVLVKGQAEPQPEYRTADFECNHTPRCTSSRMHDLAIQMGRTA